MQEIEIDNKILEIIKTTFIQIQVYKELKKNSYNKISR